MGSLVVFRKTAGGFRPDVVNLLQTFATQSALAIQNGGSTTALGFRRDGVSAISFNDPLDQMSDPVGCSGTLAIGGITSAGGTPRTIGGQSFYQIFEGDVVFNRNFQCFLGIPQQSCGDCFGDVRLPASGAYTGRHVAHDQSKLATLELHRRKPVLDFDSPTNHTSHDLRLLRSLFHLSG